MNTIAPPPEFATLQAAVFTEIEDRRALALASIHENTREVVRLKTLANERGGMQDGAGARHALQEAGKHQHEIDAARLQLRKLDDEREMAGRGQHAQLSTPILTDSMRILSDQQAELAAARAAFSAFDLAELIAAAQRLVAAARTAQQEPPALALALAQHAG